jgi:type VI secretion system protein ImpM
MSEPLIALPSGALLRGAAVGFCGKLPARGDFVVSNLLRRFVEPWHDWMQRVLEASHNRLGDDWVAAWNEAPIWRFALSAGICGPDAVLGLWMPSVDRVGRHFPLTFAALAADAETAELIADGGAFLAAAEAIGLEALASDTDPDKIAARLAAAIWTEAKDPGVAPELARAEGALWWTDGGPRVPAENFTTKSLPDDASFIGMLQADCGGP